MRENFQAVLPESHPGLPEKANLGFRGILHQNQESKLILRERALCPVQTRCLLQNAGALFPPGKGSHELRSRLREHTHPGSKRRAVQTEAGILVRLLHALRI